MPHTHVLYLLYITMVCGLLIFWAIPLTGIMNQSHVCLVAHRMHVMLTCCSLHTRHNEYKIHPLWLSLCILANCSC